jgi:hypothetical protein
MIHRESPCHANVIVLVALTQTKVVVRVSGDPVFESVTKNGEPIKDGAHETRAIGSSVQAPWFVRGESARPTLELTQTVVRRAQGEWRSRNHRTKVLPQEY